MLRFDTVSAATDYALRKRYSQITMIVCDKGGRKWKRWRWIRLQITVEDASISHVNESLFLILLALSGFSRKLAEQPW